MDLKMKKIEDITIKELRDVCPIVQKIRKAELEYIMYQCSPDCIYKDICDSKPYSIMYRKAMDNESNIKKGSENMSELLVNGESIKTSESECEYRYEYDSHALIIDNVENLTINIQGVDYNGSN